MTLLLNNSDIVFSQQGLAEYQEGVKFFHRQLLQLNTDIYLVQQILNFPFDFFVGAEKKIFFSRVVENFLNSCLLTITKLAADQGDDLYTIPRFRNRIVQLLQPQYQAEYRQILRQARFDQTTRDLLEKSRNLRNGRIAHATLAMAYNIAETNRIDFTELLYLRDTLNDQLKLMSFNTDRMMLPVEYDPKVQRPPHSNYTTDIEDILNSVAGNSPFLRLAEDNPEIWENVRSSISQEHLKILNEYRQKFRLPTV